MSLTGVWNGLYSYVDGRGSVHFMATLISSGHGFTGSIHEAIKNKWGNEVTLHAFVSGSLEGGNVLFSKEYHGAPTTYNNTVLYNGKLSVDRTEIEGTWKIAGYRDTGKFMMIRGVKVDEAATLKAYEPV